MTIGVGFVALPNYVNDYIPMQSQVQRNYTNPHERNQMQNSAKAYHRLWVDKTNTCL
jgi:hypothetical protein